MKFHQKSLIHKITTLYDIDFSQKIGFLRFFLRNVSINGITHYFMENIINFYCPKLSKNELFHHTPISLIHLKYNIVRHWFSNNQTIGFFRIKMKKVSIDASFHFIYGPNIDYFFYCPKFQKWNFIKNPWYTNIKHCRTLIFLKKLDFCDFFKESFYWGFYTFSSKIHPKFSKNQLFHGPQYIIYLWSEFYARSNKQTIRIFG